MSIAILLITGFTVAVILLFGGITAGKEIKLLAVSLAGELVYALVAMVILYFSFRKTKSPEIFFFIIFLVSMCFDSLKALFVLFNTINVAPYYGVLLTRAVYFGRFLGTLAILVSGLFSLGAEYQRMEIYIGVAFLLAFTLSAAITVDMTQIDSINLYKMGHARELSLISVIFLFFGVFNYVLNAVQNSSKDHLLIAAGLTLVIAGRELLFYTNSAIYAAIAFILLVSGAILFGERTHAVHLWT